MKMSFGQAIEFIKEHPQFKLKLPTWQDKYIKWEWSSSSVNAHVTRLMMYTGDTSPTEWTPTTEALVNDTWVVTTA